MIRHDPCYGIYLLDIMIDTTLTKETILECDTSETRIEQKIVGMHMFFYHKCFIISNNICLAISYFESISISESVICEKLILSSYKLDIKQA